MAYNPNDVFPGAQPTKQLDIETICRTLDSSQDVPAVYTFGAGAPTSLSINGADVLDATLTGAIQPTGNAPQSASRIFIEYAPPYYTDTP